MINEVVLNTFESGENVVQMSRANVTGGLPPFTVGWMINRRFNFELLETIEEAEKIFQKMVEKALDTVA